ncbi:MAG: phosphatase PAP2 family protein [Clostridia bacterium]|nr:phosphatase PAP2 family protein [Clostridia bacterium]
MTKGFKYYFEKYKHSLLVLYFFLYMPYFMFLNTFTPSRDDVFVMYSKLDDYIPFLEIFAIPYFLWFAYIAVGYIFLMLTSREEFVRMCIFLYTGMTVCLIIYTVFPNCQQLRVDYDTLGRSNVLIDWIRSLQNMDSSYDVFPSIHCLNSIGMHIAIAKSKQITKCRRLIVWSSLILAILIIMSTVFIKQHSILDVFGAFALAVPLYFLAYKPKLSFLKKGQ